MRKKNLIILLMLCLIMPFCLIFSACGKKPDDDPDKKTEFEEFSEMAVNIMSNFDLSELGGSETQGVSARNERHDTGVISSQKLTAPKSQMDQDFFQAMQGLQDKESEGNLNYYYSDIIEQVFVTTLGCGDVLQNKYNVKDFYGVKAKMVIDDGDGYIEYSSYMVEKVGDLVKLYIYTLIDDQNPNTVDDEIINHAIIDYKSSTDFGIELITFSPDYNNFHIAIVDSQYNISLLSRDMYNSPNGGTEKYSSATASNGILECYTTEKESFVDTWITAYKQSYDQKLNLSKLTTQTKNTYTEASYTVTYADMIEAFGQYVDMSESGAEYIVTPYQVVDGVMTTCNLDNYTPSSGDGSDVLPISGDTLFLNLSILESVNKLIIPANYKYIAADSSFVINKYYEYLITLNPSNADAYRQQQDQKNEELGNSGENLFVKITTEDIMELCSCDETTAQAFAVEMAKQFSITKYIKNKDNPLYGYYTQEGFSIEIVETSTLFSKRSDGNIYLNINDQQILVFQNNKINVMDSSFDTLEHGKGFDLSDPVSKFLDLQLSQKDWLVCETIHRAWYEEYNDFDIFQNVKNLIINIDADEALTGLINVIPYQLDLDNLTLNFTGGESEKGETQFQFDLTGSKFGRIKKFNINSDTTAKIFVINGEYSNDGSPLTYDNVIIEEIKLNENVAGFYTKGYLTLDMDTFEVPSTLRYLNFNCETSAYYNREEESWTYVPGDVKTSGNFTINIPKGLSFNADFSSGYSYETTPHYDYSDLKDFVLTAMPTLPSGSELTINYDYTIKDLYGSYYLARDNYFNIRNEHGDENDYAEGFVAYCVWKYYKDRDNYNVNIGFDAFALNETLDGLQNGAIEFNVGSKENSISQETIISRIVSFEDAQMKVCLDTEGTINPLNPNAIDLEVGENKFYVFVSHVSIETPVIIPVIVNRNSALTLTIDAGNGTITSGSYQDLIVDNNKIVLSVDKGEKLDITDIADNFFMYYDITAPKGYIRDGWIDAGGTRRDGLYECEGITYEVVDGYSKYFFIGDANVTIRANYILDTFWFVFTQEYSVDENNRITVSYPEGFNQYTIETGVIDLSEITVTKYLNLEDYTFAGWYLTEDFSGSPVTQLDVSNPETIGIIYLYAKYDFIPRTIKYYARFEYSSEDDIEMDITGLGVPTTINNGKSPISEFSYNQVEWPSFTGYQPTGSYNTPTYNATTREWSFYVLYEKLYCGVKVVPVCINGCEACVSEEIGEVYLSDVSINIDAESATFRANDYADILFPKHIAEFYLDEELTIKPSAEASLDNAWTIASNGDWVLDIDKLAELGLFGDVVIYAKLTVK